MDILVVQHATSAGPGALGGVLEAAGARLDIRDVETGAQLPAGAEDHDGMVILGGIMNAHEDRKHPHLAEAAGLIAAFHAASKPVLGICLGAQLISRALGGRAYRHAVPEQGFVPIEMTAAGAADPLLAGIGSPQWIMQWHDDTYDLPAGFDLLMTGGACRNQAIRRGNTYGFQCHLEATPDLVRGWLAGARKVGYHVAHPGYFARIETELATHAAASLKFCRTVGTRWMGLVEARKAA